jgi:hypothetical protein
MKISYTLTGGTDYTMLADEANSGGLADAISGFQPRMVKSPQIEQLYQSQGVFVADRGNAQWTLSFSVARVHASADAAAEFIATHAAEFELIRNLDLKIEIGATTVYLTNCAVTEVSPDPHSDKSTFIRYSFVSDDYTTSAPEERLNYAESGVAGGYIQFTQ